MCVKSDSTDSDGSKTDYADCVMVNHYMFDNTEWS